MSCYKLLHTAIYNGMRDPACGLSRAVVHFGQQLMLMRTPMHLSDQQRTGMRREARALCWHVNCGGHVCAALLFVLSRIHKSNPTLPLMGGKRLVGLVLSHVGPAGKACSCGACGTLKTVASAKVLVRNMFRPWAEAESS